MHTHPFHELYFSLQRGGTQYVDQKACPLEARQLFVLPSRVSHFCQADREGTFVGGVVIFMHEGIFSDRFPGDAEAARVLRELVDMGRGGRYDVAMQPQTRAEVEAILVPLSRVSGVGVPGHALALRIGLQSVFLALLRDPIFAQRIAHPSPGPRQRLEAVFHHIDNHFVEPLTVGELARMAGLSRSHFQALFRQAAGCGLVEHLTVLRVARARRLIDETDLPLVEIGMASGFETLTHFYRCFSRLEGLPPGRFRQRSRSK